MNPGTVQISPYGPDGPSAAGSDSVVWAVGVAARFNGSVGFCAAIQTPYLLINR